ncbi:MAG: hypothetical protein WBJ70_03850, partial [Bacilli bacterium]
NKYYHPYDFDGNMMPFKPKTVCIVMETYDGLFVNAALFSRAFFFFRPVEFAVFIHVIIKEE